MRPLLRRDLEIEVLGLHLTVRRIILLAVLACLLVLLAYTIGTMGGDDEPPEVNNTTGRYVEKDPNWPLCTVFIFLGLVLATFIVIEVGRRG